MHACINQSFNQSINQSIHYRTFDCCCVTDLFFRTQINNRLRPLNLFSNIIEDWWYDASEIINKWGKHILNSHLSIYLSIYAGSSCCSCLLEFFFFFFFPVSLAQLTHHPPTRQWIDCMMRKDGTSMQNKKLGKRNGRSVKGKV